MISPKEYEATRVIADEAGKELLSRLELMTIQPNVIVDVGCGTGIETKRLQTIYPQAKIIALDLNLGMLRAQGGDLQAVNASADAFPFKNERIDMIFANMLLPWQNDLPGLLKQWRRAMKEEALILFTALGPDTLSGYPAIPRLHDMHDLGDLLLTCGFDDPVLDVNYITLSYRDADKFVTEMVQSQMMEKITLPATQIETQFEIIYGHAFAKADSSAGEDGVAYFPLSKLRRRQG